MFRDTRDLMNFMNRLNREMMRASDRGHSTVRPYAEADGYRIEYVDGERREYRLDGDDWVRVGSQKDGSDISHEIRETVDGQELTVDLSGELESEAELDTVSYNNGVLDVHFSYGDGAGGSPEETESDEE